MSTHLRVPVLESEDGPAGGGTRRRPAWRQRLVEAERGVTYGLRGDSAFFFHFFAGSVVVATALVLGVPLRQWTAIVLALTIVLAAEMFHQVLKTLLDGVGHHLGESGQRALRISMAAVYVTTAGAVISLAIVFAQRLWEMFGK